MAVDVNQCVEPQERPAVLSLVFLITTVLLYLGHPGFDRKVLATPNVEDAVMPLPFVRSELAGLEIMYRW